MQIAGKHQDQLERIKDMINNAHIYFKKNVDRYNEFRRFVFDTALTADEKTLLEDLKKPQIEFNVLEAYISRLRGEFSKQEPSIVVMPDDGAQVDEQVLKVVEGHIRHIMYDANKNSCEYDVYTDLLSGGFSVIKVWTEYAHEKSFNQVIKFGRVFDPCLCGFDPLARHSHKGDGRFCFESFPKSKDEFEREYPNVDISEFAFTNSNGEFNWSYANQKEEIVVIVDYYEKKKKKVKLLKLADGKSMTEEQYEGFLAEWQQSGTIQQPPAVVSERKTDLMTICRYRICENTVLEYVETDFKMLPLVFVDGNSIQVRHGKNASVEQICRPYVYHAKGAQKLKNFAGQTWAAELENLVQHKFIVPKEALPQEEQYLQAYDNVQIARVMVYNAYDDNNPDRQIPAPITVTRTPIPPEVSNAFQMTDALCQTILGSFDAALGINDNQLSGVAIQEGATQSNSAAMPYVVGFLQALTQVGEIIVDLIPKYYTTPRTIPVIGMDGKRTYQPVNQPEGQQQAGQMGQQEQPQQQGQMAQQQPQAPQQMQSVQLNYDENALSLKIEAGASFAVQKDRTFQKLIMLQKVSPIFAQFLAAQGLDVLLDNMDFKGVEVVKEKALGFMKMLQEQQAKQAQQPNPEMMKMQMKQAELQQKQMSSMTESQLKMQMAQLKQQEMLIRADEAKVQAMIAMRKGDVELKAHEIDAHAKMHDANIKAKDMHHKHFTETAKTLHDINMGHAEMEHKDKALKHKPKGK